MREIKFRVFDKELKRMHIIGEGQHDSLTFYEGDVEFYNLQNGEGGGKFGAYTLMQYTGLKDKNRKEIYEGDIVKHSATISDISIVRFGEFGVPNIKEQCYQDRALGFYFENASDLKDIAPFNMTIPLNTQYTSNVEVIGNIYENPELMEENK